MTKQINKHLNRMADTSLQAHNKRLKNGGRQIQKETIKEVFKSGGSYSIYSMSKRTGISEKSTSGVFNGLRKEWVIVFVEKRKNGTGSDANYYTYNPGEKPTEDLIDWEVKESLSKIEKYELKKEAELAKVVALRKLKLRGGAH